MAGLRIYQSNRLEKLADELGKVLRQPLASPLAAEVVVVQSRGMERWLKLELAQRLGVWANMRFPFPKAFTQEVFDAICPERPADATLDREVMEWRIMDLLPRLAAAGDHAELQRYLGDGRDGRKQFQLAARVANLFDQYLVFRRDTLRKWIAGSEGDWQAALWRELCGGKLPRHPAFLMEELARRLSQSAGSARRSTRVEQGLLFPGLEQGVVRAASSRSGEAVPVAGLPERVCLFGLSALPPFYLEVFSALAAQVEVHCFVLQPSQEYWGHIRTRREQQRALRRAGQPSDAAEDFHLEEGNRLLASLGRLGREFLDSLLECSPVEEHEGFVPPGEDSLLHRVQSDILHLRQNDSRDADAEPTLEVLPSATSGDPPPSSSSSCADSTAVSRTNTTDEHEAPASSIGRPAPISPTDRSLQVHSCHSPLREVEVLRDHLLDWFQALPDLTPRDVLVMAPDIEVYAPFVQAVFGVPEQERLFIPFSVADRSPRREGRLTDAFLALLQLAGSRLTAPSVLALLEVQAVRERFDLAESDLELTRRWVRDSGIRWGRDAAHRAQLGLPALPENTWQFGLDRLLLGYAMAGEEPVEFAAESGPNREGRKPTARGADISAGPGAREQGCPRSGSPPSLIAPFDDIEGTPAEVLGKFTEFATRLFAALDELGHSRPLAEWGDLLHRVLADFFAPDETTAAEARFIREQIAALATRAAQAGFVQPVELVVVLEPLARALNDTESSGAGFLTGGVTFCALKPMRSLPFRAVCLLGMNDDAFPRRAHPLSFDLMARERRPGDRSVRDDDRYLFLETFLSARDRLYISYVGQSQRDAAESPPSVVVSELLDYLAQGFTLPEGNLLKDLVVTKHRLQAFSPAYFDGRDARRFSYSMENAAASCQQRSAGEGRPFLSQPLADAEDERRTVSLRELTDFFVNPSKVFLRTRLKLRLPDEDVPLEESEPFELDRRRAYDLRQTLVQAGLDGREPATQFDRFQALGLLPLGEAGRAFFQNEADVAREFAVAVAPHATDGWHEPVEVGLALDTKAGEFHVTGRLAPVGARGLVSWRCAKLRAKDLVRHWIQHLALNCLAPGNLPPASTLIAEDETRSFSAVTDAPAVLAELLELYWAGLRSPLQFFPETSLAFVEAEEKEGSRVPPIEKARRKWEPQEFAQAPSESEDAHFGLCFRGADPLDAEFERIARKFFEPLLAAAPEVKG